MFNIRIKGIILFLVFFNSVSIFAQTNNSLLWEITGNGLKKPSYLYGTYHSKVAQAHEFGDSVLPKLLSVEAVVIENTYKADAKSAMEHAFMKETRLQDLMDSTDYAFVVESIKKRTGKENVEAFDSMKPILISMLIEIINSPEEMPYTVDEFFKQTAEKEEKHLYGLETINEAMDALNKMSLKEQAQMLIEYFKEYEEHRNFRDSLLAYYNTQDVESMYSFYRRMKNIPVAFDKHLLEERNKFFLKGLIAHLKNESVFCAVGALHLPGETGMIESLRKKGYTVKPMVSKYTFKQKIIHDEREWGFFGVDSLYFETSMPANLNANEQQVVLDTTVCKGAVYHLTDSITRLSFFISVIPLDAQLLKNTVSKNYDLIYKLFEDKKWKQIKQQDIDFNNMPAKEYEFNFQKEMNVRYKAVVKGGYVYLCGVAGFKYDIYSDIAERFFDNIHLFNCPVYINLTVIDKKSKKPLKDFSVQALAKDMDQTITPDTIGEIRFKLPQDEDVYTINIKGPNYATVQLEVNTKDVNLTKLATIDLYKEIALVKVKKEAVSSKPIFIDKAFLQDGTFFFWESEYKEMIKAIEEAQLEEEKEMLKELEKEEKANQK